MTPSSDLSSEPDDPSLVCSRCGATLQPEDELCAWCGQPVGTQFEPTTNLIARRPFTPPIVHQGDTGFGPGSLAILQFLPSGICKTLTADLPVVLGRHAFPSAEDVLDLTEFNSVQHGVSRRHCMLLRRGDRLVVIDLASSNGTYLNDERLLPYQEYAIAHGDRLILGTLHLAVFFKPATGEEG
ncbi:MAG: FHA domain-containing protein [Chloroflexi bacterium]|nr:FHA domain-containing protein [Chloroflexota bacterium]